MSKLKLPSNILRRPHDVWDQICP